jgi:glycosyltransferase involved in cell wall biosynthesis
VDRGSAEDFNSSCAFGITPFADADDPARTALSRLRQFRRAISDHRPDLVVATGGRVVWLAALACSRGRVPWLAVAHGSELGGPAAVRATSRSAFDRADAVVAVSEFTRDRVFAAGIRPRRIEVIPNGADHARFAPDADAGSRFRAAHGLGDHPVVLTVGNVTERKGQHAVVAALPLLAAQVPDVRYVMVGRPTSGAAVEEQAARLGVSALLVSIGQVTADELPGAYNAADVFAMTSTETASGDIEGYGIAVVEAALSGLASVVSGGSGPAEAILPDRTGLVVDPADPDSVARSLASLLLDPHRREAMGAAARERALAEQTWSDRVERYGQLIDSLIRPAAPRPRRLLVVSHTPHHLGPDGLVGFGPTVRELDQLSTLFDELVHVAPLLDGDPPGNALAYESNRVRHVPVVDAGGPRPIDKLRAACEVPRWAATIWSEAGRADAVHIRAPAAIAMVSLGVLAVRRSPGARWFKYAGNWRPDHRDARSYRLQRWWLDRDLSRGEVSVNGSWPGQLPHVHSFDNPTLTDDELARATERAAVKRLSSPLELVFVGRMETEKGADRAVAVAEELAARGHQVRLRLVGDGPLTDELGLRSSTARPGAVIELLGWRTRAEVEEVLAPAHIMLLPSRSEGFPKVIAEALAFGVVPIASAVSSIPQVLEAVGAGITSDDLSTSTLASLVEQVVSSPEHWAEQSRRAATGAGRFTYSSYLRRVQRMAHERWQVDL